jgi:hypothetical protein
MKLIFLISLLFCSSLFGAKYDRVTGLIIDKGLDDIKENCTVCHPGRFIVVNGGGHKFWKYKVRVMQKGFGLWELDKKAEKRLIDYLAKNYSQKVNVSVED